MRLPNETAKSPQTIGPLASRDRAATALVCMPASADALHARREELKRATRVWEIDFRSAHGTKATDDDRKKEALALEQRFQRLLLIDRSAEPQARRV